MKKNIVFVLVGIALSALSMGSVAFAATFGATLPLPAVPYIIGSNVSTSSSVVITASQTLYIESDTQQYNTCYIVVTKNTLLGSEASISCVEDHTPVPQQH